MRGAPTKIFIVVFNEWRICDFYAELKEFSDEKYQTWHLMFNFSSQQANIPEQHEFLWPVHTSPLVGVHNFP